MSCNKLIEKRIAGMEFVIRCCAILELIHGQNGLAIALRELGRIERTLFTLDWLQSVELRRRAGRFE